MIIAAEKQAYDAEALRDDASDSERGSAIVSPSVTAGRSNEAVRLTNASSAKDCVPEYIAASLYIRS